MVFPREERPVRVGAEQSAAPTRPPFTGEPLWQRAMLRREFDREAARRLARRAARAPDAARGRPRKYPAPVVGDTFGVVRVVRCLGPGRRGRSDSSFEVECMVCGRTSTVYEFNLRAERRCAGRGRSRHA